MVRPSTLSEGTRQKKINLFFLFFLYIILNSFFIKNIALKWLYKQMGELIFFVSWESALGRSIIHYKNFPISYR